MRRIHRTALVPYTPTQMFGLVADIERYPEFVPWVTSATVLERHPDGLTGRLKMERHGAREEFTTRNVLTPPYRMELRLVDGPFKSLAGAWSFDPIQDKGTRIQLEMRFEFANPITGLLLSRSFEKSIGDLMDAFISRARQIHGR